MKRKTKIKKLVRSNKISLISGIVAIFFLLVILGLMGRGSKTETVTVTSQYIASKKQEKLQLTPTVAPKEIATYEVKKNDNLSKIAKNICGSKSAWVSLAEENNIMSPYVLHEGQTLVIPCLKNNL